MIDDITHCLEGEKDAKLEISDNSDILDVSTDTKNKYGEVCNILLNEGCNSSCRIFDNNIDLEISKIKNSNKESVYGDLSKLFKTLSDGELDINFYDKINSFKEKIIKYFNFFEKGLENGEKVDIKKVVQFFDLLNVYLAINHGSIVIWHDLYDIIENTISKLENFLKNEEYKNYRKQYSDDEINKIKFIIYRFGINHSHLKGVDIFNIENEFNDRNYILTKQEESLKNARAVNFGGHSEHYMQALNSFLINYIYGYIEILNFIEKNNLDLDLIESNFFKFNKSDSIQYRKEKCYLFFLELFQNINLEKNTKFSQIIGDVIKMDNFNDVINLFIEDDIYIGYDSVNNLEILHHVIKLFFDKIKDKNNLIKLGESLLKKDNGGQLYNSMKLRLINVILKKINLNYVNYDTLMSFLKSVQDGIDNGVGDISLFARIQLNLSKIYSELFKYTKNNDFKEKSLLSLEFYSQLFGENDVIFNVRNKYAEIKEKISNNIYGVNVDNSYIYPIDIENILNKNKINILKDINEFSIKALDNNIDFNDLNELLKQISYLYFKNICDIEIIKGDTNKKEFRFEEKKIDLGYGYFINIKIDKHFKDIYEKIYQSYGHIIDYISVFIKNFLENQNNLFISKITGLKNGNFLKKDLENFNGDGNLIIIEFDKIFVNKNDFINKLIIIHSDILKGIKFDNDFELYHLNNLKFIFFVKNTDEESNLKNINKVLSENLDNNLLSNNISSFTGKLDNLAIEKVEGKSVIDGYSVNTENLNEIIDIIEHRFDDILVYFQGIHDRNGDIDKYECLTRLRKSDGGLMFPDQIFDNITPFKNLYYKFTVLQIKRAFDIIKKTGINLSINLSTQDLYKSGDRLIGDLRNLISEYGLAVAKNIIFEVLEDSYEDKSMYDKIVEIKNLGFQVAIDDFGAGQSSPIRIMKMLEGLSIIKLDGDFVKALIEKKDVFGDALTVFKIIKNKRKDGFLNSFKEFYQNRGIDFDDKIDILRDAFYSRDSSKEFLKFLIKNKKDLELSDNVVNIFKKIIFIINQVKMFQDQGLKVVCEYVEDKDVKDVMMLVGVDLFQGYYYEKPFNSDEIING